MYIILLICGLVEWGLLGVCADGNCTQGCTVKVTIVNCRNDVCFYYDCLSLVTLISPTRLFPGLLGLLVSSNKRLALVSTC